MNLDKIKIYTYANPFKSFCDDAEYWEEIKDAPHLCISDTLVQGLSTYFGRNQFTYITTIARFAADFFDNWIDKPENDIEQYLSISNKILEIDDEKLRRSFKFNQHEVVKAVRFLLEMGVFPEGFQSEELSAEQRQLLRILHDIQDESCWGILKDVVLKKLDAIEYSFKFALKEEIVRKLNLEHSLREKYNPQELIERLECKIKNLKNNQRLSLQGLSALKSKDEKGKIQREIQTFERYLELYSDSEPINIQKIVIHGVHQFTPIIYRLIDHFTELGIEVIFLINYCMDFPKMYKTWEKVYEWTGHNFAYKSPLKMPFRLIGKQMGDLVEGRDLFKTNINEKLLKFDNITSFCEEVSRVYEAARLIKEQSNKKVKSPLFFMTEQYYAVNSSKSNDLLKVYFPEQFGEKHFLSYPVGQFILSLYNMWDQKSLRLKLNDVDLRECLSVNFWPTDLSTTPVTIYDKVQPYIKDEDDVLGVLKKLEGIKEFIQKKQKNQLEERLKQISFYNLSLEEVQYFEQVIKSLSSITEEIFGMHKEGRVSYKEHYQKLMEVLSIKVNEVSDQDLISKKEIEFVEEIKARLANITDLEVQGTIEDLKESLHYYLNRKSDHDSSRWIVRDLEQIDGGVLLSENSEATYYHFAHLSDENMKKKITEYYPWPLTNELFKGYIGVNQMVKEVVLTAYSEYRAFLRYALFYGSYFSNKKIKYSYIENKSKEGEVEHPYFLLKFLGLQEESMIDNLVEVEQKTYSYNPEIIDIVRGDRLDYDTFLVCPYRYLLNQVMEETYYKSLFQLGFYSGNIILEQVWLKFQNNIVTEDEIRAAIEHYIGNLTYEYSLPWNITDRFDISERAFEGVKKQWVRDKVNDLSNSSGSKIFLQRRFHFTWGEFKDKKTKETIVDFKKYISDDDLDKYLKSVCLEEDSSTNVHPFVCKYCNLNELCLKMILTDEDVKS